ncbi:endonuclease/exonuclease/phosphatase family protein [Ferrimonas pelagia]|uniref:Endonuclease/exonuclease/phosphatase family protein n=1 Tax=Ferrimonas pelagia TaxID=1177826 RepID=A0ABP9EZV4_9GAMM
MQFRTLGLALVALAMTACSDSSKTQNFTDTLRFATFHVDMAYDEAGGYDRLLNEVRATGSDASPRLQSIAAMIQQDYQGGRPDVLLLTGISVDVRDTDTASDAIIRNFQENYLSKAQEAGLAGLSYPHIYVAATNSGQRFDEDIDVSGDGLVFPPEDRNGYGHYHGQNSFVLLSQYPLDVDGVRTFRDFNWRDVNGASKPSLGGGNVLGDEAWDALSIMDTNFVDLSLLLPDGRRVSLLLTQFESPMPRDLSERPRQRNRDQLQFLTDYINEWDEGKYLRDDKGQPGGVAGNRPFVIMGRLQSDEDTAHFTVPYLDLDSYRWDSGNMRKLLSSYQIVSDGAINQDAPSSQGGMLYGQEVESGHTFAEIWTSMLGLRQDYVIPQRDLRIVERGVFWPAVGENGFEWFYDEQGQPEPALGHLGRLTWIDIDFGQSG